MPVNVEVITVVAKERYGIKCRCSNGNDIWYEPLTDEVDGWVERTSDGAIVKVTMDNRLDECKKMIEECAKLWQDLDWYIWGGTFTRTLRVATKLDWYKNNHRFIYHFTSFIYPFVK